MAEGSSDPEAMDWRQIQSAIVGTSFSTDKHKSGGEGWDHINELDMGVSDPRSLHTAANRFNDLLTEVNGFRESLKAQRNSLVGSGQWTGEAADSFDKLMKHFDRTLEKNADPLMGPRSYTNLLNQSGMALGTAINEVIALNHQGATRTKARYDQLRNEWMEGAKFGGPFFSIGNPPPKQPWFHRGDKVVYTSSAYPDIDQDLTRQARDIFRKLQSQYRIAASDMEQPTAATPPTSNPEMPPMPEMPPPPELPPAPELPPPADPNGVALGGGPDASGLETPDLPSSPGIGAPTSPDLPTSPGIGAPTTADLPTSPGIGAPTTPGTPGGADPFAGMPPAASPAIPGMAPFMGSALGSPAVPGGRPAMQMAMKLPESPAVPSMPGLSNLSGVPGTPGSPAIPPGLPGSPAIPGGLPISPPIGGLPGSPALGGRPGGGSAGVPALPGVPGLPTSPPVPGMPNIPGLPGSPAVPGSPGLPNSPGLPGSPAVPGSPSLPGSPNLPSSPGLPGSPGVGLLPGGAEQSRPPGSPPISPAFPHLGDPPLGSAPWGGSDLGSPGSGLGSPGSGLAAGSATSFGDTGPAGGGGGPIGSRAAAPYGGMPFMPPMMPPMAGGGQGQQERERTTWLLEDRDVWSVAGAVAPRVVTAQAPDAEDETVCAGSPQTTPVYPPTAAPPATTGSSRHRTAQ